MKLKPYINEDAGFGSVVPEGWAEHRPGEFKRGASEADPTALIQAPTVRYEGDSDDDIFAITTVSENSPTTVDGKGLFIFAAGDGALFRDAMHRLIEEMKLAIPAAFEEEDYRNQLKALQNDDMMAMKLAEENELRELVMADDEMRAAYGDAWDIIDAAMQAYRNMYEDYLFVEAGAGFGGGGAHTGDRYRRDGR